MPQYHFATAADVAPALSGHGDRFDSPEAFKAACREVWRAAEFTGHHWVIDSDEADRIMNEAVEKD